jgi:hypothetical protein
MEKNKTCISSKNMASNNSSVYESVKKLKLQTLDAPCLHGGTSNISNDVGCFKLSSEAWGAPFFEKNDFGQRKNLSFSFDPVSMRCGDCADQHRVLESGREGVAEPRLFVLADQSFPGGVPVPGSAGCVCVMREEYSSLDSLVELFIEVTRGCSIPTGSIVMIASLTHLADVGFGPYAEDLNNAVQKINRVFRGGACVPSGGGTAAGRDDGSGADSRIGRPLCMVR